MSQLTFETINTTVLNTLSRPGKVYWSIIALLFCGAALGASCWAYQIFVGVGVAGMNTPVHWGTYLINFVFWVGIAHSGTLISAILFLFRAGWRNPIARAAPANAAGPRCGGPGHTGMVGRTRGFGRGRLVDPAGSRLP